MSSNCTLTLVGSPAFATPVDAVTAEAAQLLAITGALIAKYEFTQFNAEHLLSRRQSETSGVNR